MQLVGEAADCAFQRLQLLVQVGAQALQFDRFGQIFGVDFLVEGAGVNLIIRVCIREGRGRGRLHRGFAVGHVGLVACILGGAFVHADLGLRRVLLLFLRLLGVGVGIFGIAVVLAAAVLLLVVGVLLGLVVLVVILGVGVVAQLVAVTQILDDLARKAGEITLIGQCVLQISSVSPASPSIKPRRSSITLRAPSGNSRPVARWRMRYPAAVASGASAGSVIWS